VKKGFFEPEYRSAVSTGLGASRAPPSLWQIVDAAAQQIKLFRHALALAGFDLMQVQEGRSGISLPGECRLPGALPAPIREKTSSSAGTDFPGTHVLLPL